MAKLSPSLVWELTKRDFTERFAGSILGVVWAWILPLVNLIIYIIIFSKLMGARLPGSSATYAYGVYLTAGLVPWTAFSNTISRSVSIFIEKRHIISKVNISLPSLLLFVNLSESITFIISFIFFFIFLFFTGYRGNKHLVLLPFIYYLQLLFTFGFGLLFATFTVFLRDLKEIIGVVLQFWFWFTPIVYVKEILPDIVKKIMMYNPAYILIQFYHQIFVFNKITSIKSLIIFTIITHILIFVSYLIFRTLEKDVRDFL